MNNSTITRMTEGLVYVLPGNSFKDQVCVPGDYMEFSVHSFGYFADESSFKFPFPLLLFQISACMLVTRLLYYLLRPLKQPRIVSDILGGILLGPEGLGRISVFDLMGNKVPFTKLLAGDKDQPVFRTLANVGLMFYLFLVGVKMDPGMVFRSGKKAWAIGVCSFLVPFVATVLLLVTFRSSVSTRLVGSNFMNSIVVALSMTSFAVLGDVLAELRLLNSELGRLAMSSAMVHCVFTSVNMVLFVYFNQLMGGVVVVTFAMGTLFSLVALAVFAFRPWMVRIAEGAAAAGGRIEERQIFAIFACVAAAGVASDFVGASFVFLPFIMGLCVPDGPPLGAALVDRGQLLAGEVMMPLLFLVGGKEVSFIEFNNKFLTMLAVCGVGFVAKLAGTVVPAVLSGVALEKAFLLGLIMNFRGLVEYITFVNYYLGSVVGRQTYTVAILYTVLSTSIAAPLVSTLYLPMGKRSNVGRRSILHLKPNAELRLLVCLHSENPIPTVMSLLDLSFPGAGVAPMCVYVLHLVELAGRANSSLVAHKNKKGFINPSEMARLHNVFINYEQDNRGCVSVQPYTSVAPFKTIHQDICSLAAEKSVTLVVVPFRRVTTTMGPEDTTFRANIPQILAQAPCSVGILVYPDDMIPATPLPAGDYCLQIGVLFWGGPDDREALAYAARMARHGRISLTAIHFVRPAPDRRDPKQRQLDDSLLSKVRFENSSNECVAIDEVLVRDMEQTLDVIRSLGNSYNLVIVGRRQGPNSLLGEGLADWSECPELGVVGDMLASRDFESSNSILVMQQRPRKRAV